MGIDFASAATADRNAPASPAHWLAPYCPEVVSLLQQVEEKLAVLAQAEGKLLDEAGRYIISGRGKRLRPTILLLAAEVCGGADALALETAAVVELVHTASLVHDDVLDEAASRRGKPSARALWGNKISVLVGDYLLCRALSRLEGVSTDSLPEELLSVIQQMCHGQIAEICETSPQLSEARYLEIVADKTACLLRFCGRTGARCAAAPPPAVELLSSFAERFGLAFQIADDVHDLIGSQKASGKPVNHDLRQRKVTLPLIYTLRCSNGATRAFLEQTLAQDSLSEEQLSELKRLAQQNGGIGYAWSACRQYLQQARQNLEALPQACPWLQEPPTNDASARAQRAYQTLLLTCAEAFPLPVMA